MDDIELIKQKVGIVDLIGEFLPLKKAGVNFKTNCPFHNEKTPSFVVSPERGIWHCFGCDRGGDHFKFLMEKEGMEFKDALEILAKKAGIVLKRRSDKKDKNDRLFDINQKAQAFFNYMLTQHNLGKKALEYLHKRGLTDETIKVFGLGYAPLNWEALTSFLKKRGFQMDEILTSGLAVPSKRGGYDRFRGRIIFPLIDIKDRISGFAGRILDTDKEINLSSDGPKYINTPQTPIFDKGKLLFGFNLAKSVVREKKEVVIVEGEMDMIMSYQSGVKNIVASKGTALTEDQIDAIKKNAQTINLCFDADLAGDFAARRGIELADKAGLNIKVIEVKEAKDPAELCLKDPNLWQKAIDSALPIYDYYLDSVQKRYNIKVAADKKAIFSELLPIWKTITDEMVKEHYIQKLASMLQVKDELIRKEINRPSTLPIIAKITPSNIAKKDDKLEIKDRRKLLEEYLVSLLLHIPATITYVPNFPETLFTEEELRQIYVMLVIFLDGVSFKGKSFKINEFIKTLPDDLVTKADKLYLIQIDERMENPASWQKELDSVISELKKMLIKASLEKLSLEIKQAQSFEKLDSLEILNKRFRDLSVKLKNL